VPENCGSFCGIRRASETLDGDSDALSGTAVVVASLALAETNP
jgi:hypothetical protein